jgi:UDP-N-acetylglucosamine 2-epimerase (non-hydrolysing)
VKSTALACFHSRVPFGHVEAGLRTGDRFAPYPEEINRRVAALACDYHFAPTQSAARNLVREGVNKETVFVTGNTVIDALFQIVQSTRPPSHPLPEGLRYILMTCHRREIFGHKIIEVFGAVREFAQAHPDLGVWYPVHPNPNVQKAAHAELAGLPNVFLTAPLDYIAFVHAMNGAWLILSDSGGVQEEAPALGKPVLVLRDATERPEGVTAGTCLLVGPHRDRILAELNRLLGDREAYERMARARNPYGDGGASRRIAAILRGAPADEWLS